MDESTADQLRPQFGGATLATALTAHLREAIMDGRLPPGAKLHLEELRAAFGVSLSPLREALSRLSIEGLVVSEDQKGYRVAPVSLGNFDEVTQLRVMLETLALTKAIGQGDMSWEVALLSASHRLGRLEGPHGKGEPIENWELAHREFHNALIGASRMPLLVEMCGRLHDLSDRYRRIFLGERPFDRDVAGEHRAIMEATLKRNGRKACALLQQHIERTANNIKPILAKRLAPGTRPWS